MFYTFKDQPNRLFVTLAKAHDRNPFPWNAAGENDYDEAARPLRSGSLTVYFDTGGLQRSVGWIQRQWLIATGSLGTTCAFDPAMRVTTPDGLEAFEGRDCWGDNPQQTRLLVYLFAIDAIQTP